MSINDPEIRRFIQKEVERQLNVILFGEAGESDSVSETIDNMFPGMPGIPTRPVMHPYGFVSRAVKGTISVLARVGAHVGNRMTIGHRAKDRPSVNEGESMIYSSGKYQFKIANDRILAGKNGVFEPVPMGEILRQYLISQNQLIVDHTHLGNLGVETGPALNAVQFEQLQADNLDNKKLLAQDGGRF